MKKLFVLAMFLILIQTVIASHDATIILSPVNFYETQTIEFVLSVQNSRTSLNAITSVKLDIPTSSINVTLIGDPDYNNSNHTWPYFTSSANGSITQIIWQAGSIERAVQNFYFIAKIEQVSADEAHLITITTEDTAGDTETNTLGVNLLNDDAPEVVLIEPTGGYNNQNVNFNYDVSDLDIENNLTVSCEFYLDNVLNSTIASGRTNSFAIQIAEGLHSWYLKCTDSKLQPTTTNVFDFVVDTTAPSIVLDVDDVILRTNPIEMNAEITDILSSVDSSSVRADVSLNGNIVCSINLNNSGNNYAGSCSTNSSFELGNYDVVVYAEDGLGNSDTEATTFEMTYSYLINLALSSTSINEGETVTVSGTISYDNGSSVPEQNLTLPLIGTANQNQIVNIVNDSFTASITVSDSGTYEVRAEITAENNQTYSDSEILSVNAVGSARGRAHGGGGGDIIYTCGDGYCDPTEDCNDCPSDCGACSVEEEEEPSQVSSSGGDVVYYCGDGYCDATENCDKCASDCGACPVEEEENIGFIGNAIAFFNLNGLSAPRLMIILLIAASLIGLLVLLSKSNKNKKDELGLDDYLNERLK